MFIKGKFFKMIMMMTNPSSKEWIPLQPNLKILRLIEWVRDNQCIRSTHMTLKLKEWMLIHNRIDLSSIESMAEDQPDLNIQILAW